MKIVADFENDKYCAQNVLSLYQCRRSKEKAELEVGILFMSGKITYNSFC